MFAMTKINCWNSDHFLQLVIFWRSCLQFHQSSFCVPLRLCSRSRIAFFAFLLVKLCLLLILFQGGDGRHVAGGGDGVGGGHAAARACQGIVGYWGTYSALSTCSFIIQLRLYKQIFIFLILFKIFKLRFLKQNCTTAKGLNLTRWWVGWTIWRFRIRRLSTTDCWSWGAADHWECFRGDWRRRDCLWVVWRSTSWDKLEVVISADERFVTFLFQFFLQLFLFCQCNGVVKFHSFQRLSQVITFHIKSINVFLLWLQVFGVLLYIIF